LTQARPAGSVPPTSTVVGVQSLFAEGFLVEIQVVATV
jgi:enamine deaminase RidA (YjgF/YER057c/UK114 family)